MSYYISNAFSLNMVSDYDLACLSIRATDEATVRKAMTNHVVQSVVGHEDTARVLGVKFNRQSVALERGDTLYVAQYSGPRLPEGATQLPEGASFRWLEVNLYNHDTCAAISAAQAADWGDDDIDALIDGLDEDSGYSIGYVLCATMPPSKYSLDGIAYECALGRFVRASGMFITETARKNWFQAVLNGFTRRQTETGEEDTDTIKWLFGCVLDEANVTKP